MVYLLTFNLVTVVCYNWNCTMVSWIVQIMVAIVADLNVYVGTMDMNTAASYRDRIEFIYRELLAKELLEGGLQGLEKSAMDDVEKTYEAICHLVDSFVAFPSHWV